jgi:hypothetical protein
MREKAMSIASEDTSAFAIQSLKPRLMGERAILGPEALKAACTAYDLAWAEIGSQCGDAPANLQSARRRLADIVLSVADDSSRDPKALKDLALQVMAVRSRWRQLFASGPRFY